MGKKPSEADYFVHDVSGVHEILDNLSIVVVFRGAGEALITRSDSHRNAGVRIQDDLFVLEGGVRRRDYYYDAGTVII